LGISNERLLRMAWHGMVPEKATLGSVAGKGIWRTAVLAGGEKWSCFYLGRVGWGHRHLCCTADLFFQFFSVTCARVSWPIILVFLNARSEKLCVPACYGS
jgi:hypothetical protein